MESEWLRDAIKLSLKASIHTFDDDPKERDPRLRKLVEGLQYSRKFILTYPIFILSFILLLSVTHWTETLLTWRKRRSSKLETSTDEGIYPGYVETNKHISPEILAFSSDASGSSSSDSSSVGLAASLSRKDLVEDEETPLLHNGNSLRPLCPRRTVVSSMQSVLMYQPPPIPFINKVLPSNGTSILLLAFIALNLFYIYFHINFNMFELFVLADRFGLVFVANLPLVYILAAKNQPLNFLTGRSYESLNIFHRRLGELLCLEAFFHSAGMFGVWYTLFRPNDFGLLRFLLINMVMLGIGAFLCYELLYFTSLASFRQRWYELFLALHIVFQVGGLVLVFFHHENSRPYVGAALGIFLVDRLVYRLWAKSTTVEATAKVLEDEETVKLSSTIALRPSTPLLSFFGRNLADGWQATDHIFVTVPSLSRKHIIQAHPFTIASAAPILGQHKVQLDLLIRAQDGFSRDVLNAAHLHKTLQIRLDGPYGSSHARNLLEDSDLALVAAGGSGIAVGWPLIQHVLKTSRSSDTEMASTRMLRRKIVLIWVIHEVEQISWLGQHAIADARGRGADIIIPPTTDEAGRPDLKTMIHEQVAEAGGLNGKKVRVVVSGPDGMGRVVRNTCAGLLGDGYDVDITVEKFGW